MIGAALPVLGKLREAGVRVAVGEGELSDPAGALHPDTLARLLPASRSSLHTYHCYV